MELCVRYLVIRKGLYMIISLNELKEIKGGSSSIFNATFFNAIARSLSTITDIGRSLGTSIRMLFTGKVCR